MQFLKNIKSSVYDPEYYSEILNKPFSYSLKYFLSLAILMALFLTVSASFSALPEISRVVNEIVPSVSNYYPDNLEVTIKNGKVSTNTQEPFFIKVPVDLQGEGKDIVSKSIEEKIENLLVVDTDSLLTIDAFKKYKTFILLTRDSVAYYESNGAMKVQLLDSELNSVVTKTKIILALNEIMPYLKIVPYVLVPIIFIFSFIGFVLGNLIYLIFGAAVILLAANLTNRNLGYGKSYQLGLHAITLAVILEEFIFQFFPILKVPFLFTFLMLVVVLVNFKPSNIIPSPESKNII